MQHKTVNYGFKKKLAVITGCMQGRLIRYDADCVPPVSPDPYVQLIILITKCIGYVRHILFKKT